MLSTEVISVSIKEKQLILTPTSSFSGVNHRHGKFGGYWHYSVIVYIPLSGDNIIPGAIKFHSMKFIYFKCLKWGKQK